MRILSFCLTTCLIILIFQQLSCTKYSEKKYSELKKDTSSEFSNLQSRTTNYYEHTNENLLKLVLSGEGGIIKKEIDSTCIDCPVDTLTSIEFPQYTPPINIGDMLYFLTISDYDSFISAVYLMESLWKYPSTNFEESPLEIYHLGEESLNAVDSALNFNSLRKKYELNEFYNVQLG